VDRPYNTGLSLNEALFGSFEFLYIHKQYTVTGKARGAAGLLQDFVSKEPAIMTTAFHK
jgi:hypothetical protein